MKIKAAALFTLFISLSPLGQGKAQPAYDSASLSIPLNIMGQGRLSAEQLCRFFVTYAAISDVDKIMRVAPVYIDEAQLEGVNHDVAFAQMVLETGWLQFKGVVTPQMNNFCGLGALSAANNGLSFPDERTGIKAHIQHLKAYASTESLAGDLVDPRYDYVAPKGKAPTIDALAGTWAQDPQYATKIKSLLQRMYRSIEN
jgi:hypothetical protein